MENGKNIILIGFMASGKTEIGRKLAEKLVWSFFDTDKRIEELAKKSIKHIFEQDGEDKFRELETQVSKELAIYEECVIATGGGIITREENIEALKEAGVVVFLKINSATVLRRVKDPTTRPLMNYPTAEERREKVEELMAKRAALYENCADIVIEANDDNIEQNAERIVQAMAKD
jgi:shikimate kinase